MICKQLLALFLWCHCYQIILNPLLHILALGLTNFNGYHHGTWPTSSSGAAGGLLSNYYVSGSPITAAANKVTLNVGGEIILRCNIAEYPDAMFTWYKRRVYPLRESRPEEERVQLTAADQRYTITNNVMTIKSSTMADVGDYFCHIQGGLEGVAEDEKMIIVRPKPYILEFDLKSSTYKSAVVEEGEPLKIPCNVIDEYYPSDQLQVKWTMAKYDEDEDMTEVVSGEEDIEVINNNRTSVDLRIGKVTRDHRRLYKCQVSNGVTENSKTILIRVKNKYTVIWPAVGIVIELVILIGVIIVVENRRVEPDKGGNWDRKAIHQM